MFRLVMNFDGKKNQTKQFIFNNLSQCMTDDKQLLNFKISFWISYLTSFHWKTVSFVTSTELSKRI